MFEFFKLIFISFHNTFYNVFHKVREFIYFFPDFRFIFLDCLLYIYYFFTSPFSLRNIEGKNLPVTWEELTYGEIYYYTARDILSKIEITSDDILVDIGSGRGKMVFFASMYFKCRAFGVELLPTFVKKSSAIGKLLKLNNIFFIQGNFLDFDFSEVSVIYFAGTCISDDKFELLLEAIKKAPSGAKFINLSYPVETDFLKLMGREKMYFSWGSTLVYFYERI